MKNFTFLIALLICTITFGQQNFQIDAQSMTWSPNDLTINTGDSVTWVNNSAGNHNVNGTTTIFTSNPESFFSGSPSTSWTFGKRFTIPGVYLYRCDIHNTMMFGKITVVDPPVGIAENTLVSMKFGPNPVKDILTFTTDSKDFSVQLFDMLGNKVISQRMKDQNQLDISALNSGMYMIEIKNGDQTIKKKLIKK